MKNTLCLLVLLAINTPIIAQQDTAFIYTYGGIKDDICSQIRATDDKGYIMIGTTSSFGLGSNNMYVIKIDSACKPQWSSVIGSKGIQIGCGITTTSDKGYAIVGYVDNFNNGGYDACLVKMDSNGNMMWRKTYGGSDWDFAYSVKQTWDGGFILCGQTYSYGAGNGDVYVIRTDKNGDTLWTRAVGGTGDDIGNSVIIRNDSLYLIVGSTTSYGKADTNAYLIELNDKGDLLASKTHGSVYTSVAYAITPSIEGGYMITGSIDSIFKGIQGELLLKIDSEGNKQWMYQVTNGTWDDAGHDVAEANDTTYFSAGTSYGGGFGSSSMHIMRHTAAGDYLAGPSMGGSKAQYGYSVTIGQNKDILFAGASSSYGQGDLDFYVIRLKDDSMVQNYTLVIKSYADTPVIAGILANTTFIPGVKVFPNPSKYSTNILIQGQFHENYWISLSNEIGEEVIHNMPCIPIGHDQALAHIETSILPAGIYFYRVHTDHGIVSCGKLIVIK